MISNINKKRIGSITAKHRLAFSKYWTLKKMLNLLLCEAEKRTLRETVRAMPYTATIDVTNICNLHCPGCPTGLGLKGRRHGYLDLRHLEQFLDEAGEYLFIANLYNWGESLLHPAAAQIVKLVHERRIFTSMSSNLNIADFGRIRDVIDAGLDHMIVSADGVSALQYEEYRKGGNWDLMLGNLRRIIDYKKASGRTTPVVEWQMLSFRHLEADVRAASELAEAMGTDWFTVRGPMAPDHLQPEPGKYQGSFYGGKTMCDLLWHNITLQSDGGIAPCCFLYHKEDDFGAIGGPPFRILRNNATFRFARRLFDSRAGHPDKVIASHPCLRCPVVHKQAHLKQLLHDNPGASACPDFMAIVSGADEIETIKKRY